MKRDNKATWSSLPRQRPDAAQAAGTISRRRLVVAAGAMTGAAILGRPTNLRTPSNPGRIPVASTRDWRGERWVGTWAAAMHAPSAGFGEEFPSQFFEFDKQTVRQIVRTSIGGDQVRVRLRQHVWRRPVGHRRGTDRPA